MKAHILYCTFFLATFSLQAQQQKDSIKGLWLNHDGNTVIEIFEEADIFHARVYEILKFPKDKVKGFSVAQLKKAKEKMKGRLVLTDLSYDKKKWIGGKILNPQDNTVKANCSLLPGNSPNELKIKIKKGFFSVTKIWTRYETNDTNHEK